jgi:hypothetical protein
MGISTYDVVLLEIIFLKKSCGPVMTILNFSGVIQISAGSMTPLICFSVVNDPAEIVCLPLCRNWAAESGRRDF